MKEFVDQKGNLIFEINSRKIIINISKLRSLMGAGILSVSGCMKSFSGRISDDGEVFRKESKKEGSIHLNLKRIVNPRDKNSVIQRKIIEILSHEAKHIFQLRSKGRFLKFCSNLRINIFLPLVIICILNLIAHIIFREMGFKAPIYWDILLIFSPAFLIFLQVCYLLDPEEIDAREFADKAIKNKKWLEIVKVKTIK